MREGTFISRNRERWEQYQQQTDNPDEQADRLIQLTDDLGYAKTFYPESKTTRYINALAACQFIHLYQNRRADYKRLWRFWQYELPLLFGRYHRIYLFTFCFFLLCVMLGVIGSIHDPELVRAVLGDDYVSMTEENIARGDPFGVYKSGHEVAMFIRIAANNIRVSLMLFSTGILAGVGSLYLLFENGIMLGTFQQLFFAKGLGWASVLVIWIHGTLEISSVIIAGTSGLILGHALLFPGTYTRIESLKRGARDAVKIIFGILPFFLLAAFFEGFVTRHTHMPVGLSLSILLFSAALIIWYFILYPRQLQKAVSKQVS